MAETGKELFPEALGMEDRETVIADCRAVMEALTDCSRIDGEAEEVSNEMEVVAGMIQRLVDGNAARKPQRGGSQHKDLKAAGRFQGVLDILPAVFMMIFLHLWTIHKKCP